MGINATIAQILADVTYCDLHGYFSDCVREGIDYFDGDIFSQTADNAMQCAIGCEKEEVCKRWSLVESTGFRSCVLMEGAPNSISSNTYRISGFPNSGTDICGKYGNCLKFSMF